MSFPTFLDIVLELEQNSKITSDEATHMRANYNYFQNHCSCIHSTFSGWAAGLNDVLYLDTSLAGLERALKGQSYWKCAYIIRIVPN